MLEERYTEIDRENRILLKKMTDIAKHQHIPQLSARQPGPQSLNREARKKELLRITKDNQSILKRIQQAQPVYNHVELEGTHRRNLSYLKNCSEFPLVLRSARGRPSELVPLAGAGAPQASRPASARSSKTAPAGEDASDPPSTCLEYVLKDGKMIGDTYYLIEMATDGRALYVSAYEGDTQTTLELTVEEKVHRKLFRETDGDYSLIAQQLTVDDDRLVLVEGGASLGELSAEAMCVRKARSGSAGSVVAEIDLGLSGDPQVRVRGLTASSGATTRQAWTSSGAEHASSRSERSPAALPTDRSARG